MSSDYGGEYNCDFCGAGWMGAENILDGKDWCGDCRPSRMKFGTGREALDTDSILGDAPPIVGPLA